MRPFELYFLHVRYNFKQLPLYESCCPECCQELLISLVLFLNIYFLIIWATSFFLFFSFFFLLIYHKTLFLSGMLLRLTFQFLLKHYDNCTIRIITIILKHSVWVPYPIFIFVYIVVYLVSLTLSRNVCRALWLFPTLPRKGLKCQLITVLAGQTILMEGKRSDTEGSVLP